MLKSFLHALFVKRLHLVLMAAGAALAALSLWQMGHTALFVYKASAVPAEVVDVVQQPFDGTLHKLRSGNAPWAGDIAYRPIVRFALPGNGARITRLMPDSDADNADIGSQTAVLTLPLDPSSARVYKPRLLWGGDTCGAVLGLLLMLVSRLLRPAAAAKPTAKKAPDKPKRRRSPRTKKKKD